MKIYNERVDKRRNIDRVKQCYLDGMNRAKAISKHLGMRYNTVCKHMRTVMSELKVQPVNEYDTRLVHSIGSKMGVSKITTKHYNQYNKVIKEDGTVETITVPAQSVSMTFNDRGGINEDELIRRLSRMKPAVQITSDVDIDINKDDIIAIVALFDAHMDKVSLLEEVGEANNFNTNSKRFMDFGMNMVKRAVDNANTIMIPLGNDLFNHDGLRGTTAGTPQDSDGIRNEFMIRIVEKCIELINYALSFGVKVIVPVVKGNHDANSCYILQEYLKIYYRNNELVEVMDSAKRSYVQYGWGKTLIVFVHGDGMKVNDFMDYHAHNDKEHSKYDSIQIYGGHFHKESVVSKYNTTYTTLRSVSCTDKWHNSKGYVSPKSAYCICFKKDMIDEFCKYKITE